MLLLKTLSLGFWALPLIFLRMRYLIFCLALTFEFIVLFYFILRYCRRFVVLLLLIYPQTYLLFCVILHLQISHLFPCMVQAYADCEFLLPPGQSIVCLDFQE